VHIKLQKEPKETISFIQCSVKFKFGFSCLRTSPWSHQISFGIENGGRM